eukprot:66327_1
MNQSIFTIDLEAEYDPLKPGYRMSSIFKVSHPSRIITLDYINSIIKNIKDPESPGRGHAQKVQYEIGMTAKWFIVAAKSRIPRGIDELDPVSAVEYASILERRSILLLSSLQKHFVQPDDEIASLEDVLMGTKVSWSSVKRIRRKRDHREVSHDDHRRGEEKRGVVSRLLNAVGLRSLKRKNSNESPIPKKKHTETF